MPEPVELIGQRADAVAAEMRRVLAPETVWKCGSCGHPIEREEPFGADILREQLWHLNESSSVVNLAMYQLLNEGVLSLDNRLRLTVQPDALTEKSRPEISS